MYTCPDVSLYSLSCVINPRLSLGNVYSCHVVVTGCLGVCRYGKTVVSLFDHLAGDKVATCCGVFVGVRERERESCSFFFNQLYSKIDPSSPTWEI